MDKKERLLQIFSKEIRSVLEGMEKDFKGLQEIRLRIQRPLLIIWNDEEYYVNVNGNVDKEGKSPFIVTKKMMKETLECMSSYSLYAFEEEIRQGFITIQGGHRIGIAGKTVLDEREIRTIKYISYINVRLAHQIPGCAEEIMPYLCKEGKVLHTLIISPPRCGKTTLLRDVVRQISDGSMGMPGMTVGVVDERSEIASCFQGEPQNDIGIRTDVLDCCPKAKGMLMLIRTMSPRVIAVDEIGSREDVEAIEYVINCGCKLLATVHGNSIEDIRQKPVLRRLVQEKAFERYVVLDGKDRAGTVSQIYDSMGNSLYRAEAGGAV